MDRFSAAAVLAILLVAAPAALGQRGDRPGHDMVEVWREMDVPAAPVVEPEDALETFRVAPGFRLELVAAEPLVEDPVAMAFDEQGRMWVVEMRGFMPNVDGEGEDEPVGRVVVLEDTNGDGQMDRSTVFLDELVMPRAIAIVEGGVLISEPPNLWFCEDLTGDLKCDERTRVLDYARQGPVEHTDNGLMHGLDNWIYNAKSSLRFKFGEGEVTASEETHFRGQWGIAQDNYGRLYYNHNSHYLYADYFPEDYLRRNGAWSERRGINANIVNSNEAWPIRVNPGVNRGYMDHQLRDDGRLNRITAISDVAIYRGDQFGEEYIGDAFIPEPAGNTIAHFRLREDGVELRGEHVTYEDAEWERRDFVASTDERFRPVSIYNGPDGALYVLDMYRGILQHKVYVTTYLRNYILEQGLDKPLGLGRIYRIVREDEPVRREPVNLAEASTGELVRMLSHGNGWHRSTAQRLLVQRNDAEALRGLRSLAQNGRAALGRLHALWTLEGMGAVDLASVLAATEDPDPQVRIAGLRTAEQFLEGEEASLARQRLLPRVIRLTEHGDQAVRVQAAFTLGSFVGGEEGDRAKVALADMLSEQGEDGYIRQAVISGLGGYEMAMLAALLEDGGWSENRNGAEAVLRELSATCIQAGRATDVTRLLGVAADERGWRQEALLAGLVRGAERRGSAVELPGRPRALEALGEAESASTREAAEKIAAALDWPDADKVAEGKEAMELTEEQEELRLRGRTMYMALCMACHQPHGQGQQSMAPSLVGSDVVLGSPEKLTRIVLDGVTGLANGEREWNMVMPGMRENPALNDERLAGMLTYIRREWGNEASPVDPETIEKVREATEGRREPWTKEELEALD